MSRRTRQRKRFQKRNAQRPDAKWRAEPATELQWRVLRRIERETGAAFPPSMTKGQASDAIARRLAEDLDARRAARRAARARKRAA